MNDDISLPIFLPLIYDADTYISSWLLKCLGNDLIGLPNTLN
jgi:hypothetical protein